MEVKNSSEQLQKILSAILAVSNQQEKESYLLLKYEILKLRSLEIVELYGVIWVPWTKTIGALMVNNAPLVSLCVNHMTRSYDTRNSNDLSLT